MKKSEILKEARKRIENGERLFVCSAIMSMVDEYSDYNFSRNALILRQWIHYYIQNAPTVIRWLQNSKGITLAKTTEVEKEYRLAWIDDMIAYWESQND